MDTERPAGAGLIVRPARPADYDAIVAAADPWWGRPIRFHQAMGFTIGGPVGDYNGPGRDMITFELAL
jgi:hypothetical protein